MNIQNKIGQYRQAGRSWYTRDVKTITKFSLHHTASLASGTDDDILRQLAQIHYNNGWPGLSYHYIIINGNIYQINKHEEVTWIDGVNWDAIGVCIHGYYHSPHNQMPSKRDLEALKWLMDKLSTEHPEFPADQNDTLAHRERASTACPGDNLYPYVKEYRDKLGNVNWSGEDEYGNMVKKSNQWDKTCNYYELGKPNDTLFEKLQAYVGGIKSESTALNNDKNKLQVQVNELGAKLTNKEEELARKMAECQSDAKMYLAQIDALNKDLKSIPTLTALYEGRLKEKDGRIDAQGKEIGNLKIKITNLETEIKQLTGKTKTSSFWSLTSFLSPLRYFLHALIQKSKQKSS